MLTTTSTTQQERFQKAVRAIRKQGITTRQNARKCCRSCLAYDLGAEGHVPYAFTYGSQGSAYTWRDDRPVWVDRQWNGSQDVDKIFWNYDAAPTGEVIAAEFRKEGFTVEWDGTSSQCVMIAF
jgi:hypothetical protein